MEVITMINDETKRKLRELNMYDAYAYCQRVIRSCNGDMKYYPSVCNLIDNFYKLYKDGDLHNRLDITIAVYLR